MNEAQRQFAMGVAGVRLWYARAPLPGAAPSPAYDFGESEQSRQQDAGLQPAAAAPARRPASDASRQGLARLQGMLAGTSPEHKGPGHEVVPGSPGQSAAQPVDVPLPDAPVDPAANVSGGVSYPEEAESSVKDAVAGESVSFHWRLWSGDQWLIVSTCPDVASRGLEDSLAGNILRALGESVRKTEALKWPVFGNPAVPGNDAAGAVDVVSALAAELDAPHQLWLGLEPDEEDSGGGPVWRRLLAPLGDATVSFPRSLVALSSDPAGKRALWQALRQAARDR